MPPVDHGNSCLLHNHPTNTGSVRSVLETLSVVGPVICLVDCVVIPLVLALLPLSGIHHIYHGVFDQALAFIVVAICAPVIGTGFFKHRRKRVLILMSLGFGMMFFANFLGHCIDDTLHTVVTVVGSILLIKANLDNKRFSKCGCHHAVTVDPE